MSATVSWIADEGALASLVDELAPVQRLALDTEANGLHAYRASLCVMQLGWATGDNVPVTPLSDIKTDADFGTIDLATTGLFLGNAYKAPDWEAGEGGTWSGTITLTYDVASGGSEYGTWSGGELFDGDKNGDGVTNGIAFLLGAANPDEDASGQLPTATQSGGGLVLTFSCLDAASRGASVLNVQYSNDLGVTDLWSANTAAVPEPPGATVNEVIFVSYQTSKGE